MSTIQILLLAEMQKAQLWLVAGFILLGWVLARRQVKMRRRVNRDAHSAHRALKQMREHQEPSVPLSGAPPETQRWQGAMFDLQRELKADLDTRIVVVQTLLRQVDERIRRLESLDPSAAIAGSQHGAVKELIRTGHTAAEIAVQTGLPIGDVELAIATMRSHDLT